MTRPYALLRVGFPYVKTLGTQRKTDHPVDVAFGKDGTIYVLLSGEGGASIRKLSWEDDDLGVINGIGAEFDGKVAYAHGAASLLIDRDENLYVSDEGMHGVTVLSTEGDAQRGTDVDGSPLAAHVGRWGELGDGDGQLNRPSGLAFDGDENVYVVDTLNHRVQKFTKDGKYLLKWGGYGDGDGEFNLPWGITVDELGDVYVADWHNDRVQKFDAEGNFIFKFGQSGIGDGDFNRPTGVAVDLDGDIYVSEGGNNRVQQFTAEGRYLDKFIGDATLSRSAIDYMMVEAKPLRLREIANLEPQKRFRYPKNITVDAQRKMFVPDYYSHRVQIYQKQAIPLEPHQMAPVPRSPTLT